MYHILSLLIVLANADLGYDYLDNGDDWLTYFSACKSTPTQSPIDLGKTITQAPENSFLFAKYTKSVGTLTNFKTFNYSLTVLGNFGSLYVMLPPGSYQEVGNFVAAQIFFRAKSEHTINGVQFPLEIQIYHNYWQNFNNKKVALSIMVSEGTTANPFLQSIIDAETNKQANLDIDLSSIIPTDTNHGFFYYNGSLTYPYCTAKVTWYVIQAPIIATAAQLTFFTNLYTNNPNFKGNGNFRKVQSGAGITVYQKPSASKQN